MEVDVCVLTKIEGQTCVLCVFVSPCINSCRTNCEQKEPVMNHRENYFPALDSH